MGKIKESDLTAVSTLLDTGFVRCLLPNGDSRIMTVADAKTLFSGGGGGGINEIKFVAGEFNYPSTNPAPLDTLTLATQSGSIKRHLFDDTTAEFLRAQFVLPATLNAGTVTFEIYGGAITVASGKYVRYELEHSAKANGEDLDTAYGSLDSGNLGTLDTNQDYADRLTFTETIANLGWAANDLVDFQLSRVATIAPNVADDLVGDYGMYSLRIILP